MLQFDENLLREQLDGLAGDSRAVFAAACAERKRMASSRAGAGPASAESKTMMDQLWRHLLGDRGRQEELAELSRRAEALVPRAENADAWTPESALSENAFAALAYALTTAATGDSQTAVWCARQAIEALDLYASQRLGVRSYDTRTERAIVGDPLIQAELQRQAADVQELAHAQGKDSRAAIRDRAQQDAVEFFPSRRDADALAWPGIQASYQPMTIDWDNWQPFDGAPGRPLADVDRATAQRYFDQLTSARPERKAQLETLLVRNGVSIGTDDVGLQALDNWYQGECVGDRA